MVAEMPSERQGFGEVGLIVRVSLLLPTLFSKSLAMAA
jgi:hypothetical protein